MRLSGQIRFGGARVSDSRVFRVASHDSHSTVTDVCDAHAQRETALTAIDVQRLVIHVRLGQRAHHVGS